MRKKIIAIPLVIVLVAASNYLIPFEYYNSILFGLLGVFFGWLFFRGIKRNRVLSKLNLQEGKLVSYEKYVNEDNDVVFKIKVICVDKKTNNEFAVNGQSTSYPFANSNYKIIFNEENPEKSTVADFIPFYSLMFYFLAFIVCMYVMIRESSSTPIFKAISLFINGAVVGIVYC